jgi:hypothetical protein
MNDDLKAKSLNIYTTIKKLIGGIEPTGEHNLDIKKFDNIKVLIEVLSLLLLELYNMKCEYENDEEQSIKQIIEEIKEFFDWLENYI